MLVFLTLIVLTEVSQSIANVEFSDEKEEIFEHSRVLFGYNAILVNQSDITINCWVILKDKGDYDVTWKGVVINSTIKELTESEVKIYNELLTLETKVERQIIVKTPYADLTEEDLGLRITFSFFEVDSGGKTHEFAFNKNYSTSSFGFMLPVLIGLGIIKRRKRN